jgi:hypothetical protein
MCNLLIGLAATLGFLGAVASIDLLPPSRGAVAVVANPFDGQTAVGVIAAAGGRLIRSGPWPWIAVGIKSADENFAPALRKAGALAVLSPLAAGGCRNETD